MPAIYDKNFFTILDFWGVTQLFDDPDWDGTPIQDEAFGEAEQSIRLLANEAADDADGTPRLKYQVSRQEFRVARERVSYYDKNGKLTTESLKDYTRRTVSDADQSLDRFLTQWKSADRQRAIVDELQSHGVILAALADLVGKEYDLFDLVCHVAFDRPPLTRQERADQVRKRDVFSRYGETARAVLAALLDKYADQDVVSIEDATVLQLDPFAQLGTPLNSSKALAAKNSIKPRFKS